MIMMVMAYSDVFSFCRSFSNLPTGLDNGLELLRMWWQPTADRAQGYASIQQNLHVFGFNVRTHGSDAETLSSQRNDLNMFKHGGFNARTEAYKPFMQAKSKVSLAGDEDSGPHESKMIVILSAEPATDICRKLTLNAKSSGKRKRLLQTQL